MKNKINNKSSLLLALVLIITTACSDDFLEKNPLNSVSSQTFWNSEGDVLTSLAGVYSRLQQNFLGYERVYLDGLSDNAWLDPGNGNQRNLLNMTTGSISPGLGGGLSNMYSTPYRAVTACNYFLDNIDKAPLEKELADTYKAEVRFIRALAYFDLVQSFGGVIIYRHYPKTVDEAKIAKSSVEDVYAFIEEDLQFGIAHLPESAYKGRAVKGSAQALLGRVLLTQEKWAQAADVLKEVIDSDLFALSPSYKEIFLPAGQQKDEVKKEILFSTRYLAPENVHRTNPGAAGINIELGWWSLMQPYEDLANDYLMTDGLSTSTSPLFDPQNPFENRDPRMKMTIKVPGETWYNSEGEAWEGSYESYTGFLVEKYVDLDLAPFTTQTARQTDQDYIHIRYADVLLMYAEARNEAQGPSAEVFDALDQIRARPEVSMPSIIRSEYPSKEMLRSLIRHERRIELALEGQRYNDLKRWRQAHIKLPTLKTPDGTQLVFEEKHYLLPFQLSELENNPNLKQNEGYNQ